MRSRRTKSEMSRLRDAMMSTASEYPMTVRHLFYRLVSMGLIEKTEKEYNQTVIRLCGELREAGAIDWWQIVDESRYIQTCETFGNASDALSRWARQYREPLWKGLLQTPIVLVEKDAMAGVFTDLCTEYDAPLLPVKGFCSKTMVHRLAQRCLENARDEQQTAFLVFGDHDPSGVLAPEILERTMLRYIFQDERPEAYPAFYRPCFIRLAINPDQVEEYGLPTRPAKPGNVHGTDWEGGCVELDAMRPTTLQHLLERHLRSMLPTGHLSAVRRREEEGVEALMQAGAFIG